MSEPVDFLNGCAGEIRDVGARLLPDVRASISQLDFRLDLDRHIEGQAGDADGDAHVLACSSVTCAPTRPYGPDARRGVIMWEAHWARC
jgi:hypothetical protein